MIPAFHSETYWLRSKNWDSFWMLSGIWLLIISLFLHQENFEKIYIIATFFLWIGHRLSSTYLAFFTPAYGSLIQRQYIRFFICPPLIILFVFTILLMPESWCNITLTDRILLLITLDYFINLQHFAMQHYGIMRIYHLRAKLTENEVVKNWEKKFCLGVGGFAIMISELLQGASHLSEMPLFAFFPDIQLESIWQQVQIGATVLILGTTISLIYFSWKNENMVLSKLLYLLSISGLGVSAFYLHPFMFLMIWTTQHWLASVGIGGHMASNEQNHDTDIRWYKVWSWSNQNFWRVILVFSVLSILLTPIMEVELSSGNNRYGIILFPIFKELGEMGFLTICLIGIGFSTGFIHYLMDRSIFRLSNPTTRKYTKPLLV